MIELEKKVKNMSEVMPVPNIIIISSDEEEEMHSSQLGFVSYEDPTRPCPPSCPTPILRELIYQVHATESETKLQTFLEYRDGAAMPGEGAVQSGLQTAGSEPEEGLSSPPDTTLFRSVSGDPEAEAHLSEDSDAGIPSEISVPSDGEMDRICFELNVWPVVTLAQADNAGQSDGRPTEEHAPPDIAPLAADADADAAPSSAPLACGDADVGMIPATNEHGDQEAAQPASPRKHSVGPPCKRPKLKLMDADKEAARIAVLRRNPRRASAPPPDYCELGKRKRRGQWRQTFDIDSLRTTRRLRPRVSKQGEGAVLNPPDKLHLLPRRTWSAFALERPTLADVFALIPPKPTAPSWSHMAHQILQCVLEMLARHKSAQTTSFDRVAGKLRHIAGIRKQIKAAQTAEEDAAARNQEASETDGVAPTEDEKKQLPNRAEQPSETTSNRIMLIDLTGDESEEELLEVEEDVEEAVCEMLDKVWTAEQWLREQAAENTLEAIRRFSLGVPSDPALDDADDCEPRILNDLNDLLGDAAHVYCLANKDVSPVQLMNYLDWLEWNEQQHQCLM